jgi:hypothetical protein
MLTLPSTPSISDCRTHNADKALFSPPTILYEFHKKKANEASVIAADSVWSLPAREAESSVLSGMRIRDQTC